MKTQICFCKTHKAYYFRLYYMYELFYKYLLLNNKAYLPYVGSFSLTQIPASMDFENKKLIPPSQLINLNTAEVGDTNPLYKYLSKELMVTEEEAAYKLDLFSKEIQEQINSYGSVLLPGLGRLKKSYIGTYDLEQERENKEILPDIWIDKSQAANTSLMEVYSNVTPGIIRREGIIESQEVFVKPETEDYWWVYAIILAVMGLGALLYYYI